MEDLKEAAYYRRWKYTWSTALSNLHIVLDNLNIATT